MRRVFDILTAPFLKGPCSGRASLSWPNPRNFDLEVAPQIVGDFKIVRVTANAASADRTDYQIELECLSSSPTRFAALVSCDTDDLDQQCEDPDALCESIRASWSSLDKKEG